MTRATEDPPLVDVLRCNIKDTLCTTCSLTSSLLHQVCHREALYEEAQFLSVETLHASVSKDANARLSGTTPPCCDCKPHQS